MIRSPAQVETGSLTHEKGEALLSRNHDDWFLFGFSGRTYSTKRALFCSPRTYVRNKAQRGSKTSLLGAVCLGLFSLGVAGSSLFSSILSLPPSPPALPLLLIHWAQKYKQTALYLPFRYFKMKSPLCALNISRAFRPAMTKTVLRWLLFSVLQMFPSQLWEVHLP